MNLEDQIIAIIAQTLHIDESLVTPDLAIGDVEEWDSMGNVLLIAALEEQLAIEFPLDDLFELTSVRAIIDKVTALRDDASH